MELLLVLIIGIIVVVVALKLIPNQSRASNYPYIKNQVLFSPAERSFLGVLDLVSGEQYRVFGKVRIADVVSVKSVNHKSRRQAFNRINAKHFDFVLCRKDDLSLVAAIELDDKSHQSKSRQQRDAFIVELCRSISLPLIQIPAKAAYNTADIHARLQEAIKTTSDNTNQPAATAISIDVPKPHADVNNDVSQHASNDSVAAKTQVATCPNCSSPMVIRSSKAGANAGQKFWGCSAYPKCRSVVPIELGEQAG